MLEFLRLPIVRSARRREESIAAERSLEDARWTALHRERRRRRRRSDRPAKLRSVAEAEAVERKRNLRRLEDRSSAEGGNDEVQCLRCGLVLGPINCHREHHILADAATDVESKRRYPEE